MKKLPIFLNLENKKVLVIGAGKVGFQKVSQLIVTGADLTIISKEISSNFKDLIDSKSVLFHQREIKITDLDSYDLVFSATNNSNLNEEITKYARSKKIWINCVDDPKNCDFFSGAVIDHGPIRIAISTDGKFAGLTRLFKQVLNTLIPKSLFLTWTQIVSMREKILNLKIDIEKKREVLNNILNKLETEYFELEKLKSLNMGE